MYQRQTKYVSGLRNDLLVCFFLISNYYVARNHHPEYNSTLCGAWSDFLLPLFEQKPLNTDVCLASEPFIFVDLKAQMTVSGVRYY